MLSRALRGRRAVLAAAGSAAFSVAFMQTQFAHSAGAKSTDSEHSQYVGIHMRDPIGVREKVERMVGGGLPKLQVIADFDNTITQPSGYSSWTVVEKSNVLSPAYRQKTLALLHEYYPKEISPDLTMSQKIPLMEEWWHKAQQALIDEYLTREVVEGMVDQSADKVILREETKEMFRFLNYHSVPVLIFSAGVGDIIYMVLDRMSVAGLKHAEGDAHNVHIVSNFLKFDEETGHTTGFGGAAIHVFNKSEVVLGSSPFYSEVVERKNVLLMGDSLGDVHMADGIPHDCVLRVGFLNIGVGNNINALLEKYKKVYDVVLVGDNSMGYANKLLRQIAYGEAEN